MIENLLNTIDEILEPYYRGRLKIFQALIGYNAVSALFFMPSSVVERKFVTEITPDLVGKTIIADFCVKLVAIWPSRARPISVVGQVGGSRLEILFFNSNAKYIRAKFKVGECIKIVGKLSAVGQIVNPQPASQSAREGLCPIYPLKTGLTQEAIYSVVRKALELLKSCDLPEWLPQEILGKYGFATFYESLKNIHNPSTPNISLIGNKYRQRLCFDELLAEQIKIQIAKNQEIVDGICIENSGDLIEKFIKNLPFSLTDSQRKASAEIFADMRKTVAMHRLVQGDVGSGKTIVAILAMLYAIGGGYQAALLVPTDILARQHYRKLLEYLQPLGISTAILTANEKGKLRRIILENVWSGATKIVVGTHALLNDNLNFRNLGLVVIDEQHRFGVAQRLRLINKARNPHILSMTATPIPRTTIMTQYGDIDVSPITSKPAGRREIIMTSCAIDKIDDIIEAIQRILQKSQKVYWVCPLVEKSEKLDYAYVLARYEFLKSKFGDAVGILHGRMKNIEKQEIFDKFYRNTIKILVSTTVIEVGVDDPNATAIIIENAERFGLAQLHQLRGRVGRSDLQSYCILLYGPNCSGIARQRIAIMRATNDGFAIAEQDLRLRGGGEIHGIKQSGQKQYKTFSSASPEEQDLINAFTLEANRIARAVTQTSQTDKYYNLLKIFTPEFELNVSKSF